MSDTLDIPTAWAIQKALGPTLEHNARCSSVPGWDPISGPHLLCDCGAVEAEWKRQLAEESPKEYSWRKAVGLDRTAQERRTERNREFENELIRLCEEDHSPDKGYGYVLSAWVAKEMKASMASVNQHLRRCPRAYQVRPNPGGYALWWHRSIPVPKGTTHPHYSQK